MKRPRRKGLDRWALARHDHLVDGDFNQALDASAPICPGCLHQRELVGDPVSLYWACPCGLTPIRT